MENLWTIILAAGRGTRMKSSNINKVAYKIKGIPMLTRTILSLKEVGVANIVVVVGFAKESVLSLLDSSIKTIEQKTMLGTGNAVKAGLLKIPPSAEDVLVLNGDDSFLLDPKLLKKMHSKHQKSNSKATFLSVGMDTPGGLGRVVRGENGKVLGIIEEKDATDEQRKIKEVNGACYIFDYPFLKKYIGTIKKSGVTGEYYIVNLIQTAAELGMKVEAYRIDKNNWRGVNTPEELLEAEKLTN